MFVNETRVCMTTERKATEQCLHALLFISCRMVLVLNLKFVYENLVCNH